MNEIDRKIESYKGFIRTNAGVMTLGVIVICTAAFIINESARFLNLVNDGPAYWGFIGAVLTEIIAMALVCFRPKNRFTMLVVKHFLLVSIFIVMVGGAAMFAVTPTLHKTHMSTFHKLRIETLTKELDSIDQGIKKFDKSQQLNIAMERQRGKKVGAELQEVLKEAQANAESTGNVIYRDMKIAIIILLRFLLQSANWLLISWICSIMERRHDAQPTMVQRYPEPYRHDTQMHSVPHQPEQVEVDQVQMEVKQDVEEVYQIEPPVIQTPVISENAQKVLDYISSREQPARPNLITSRILKGAKEYDEAAEELKQAGLIWIKNGTGRAADIRYGLNGGAHYAA